MNAGRLSHLKNAGASAAVDIARQGVLADIQEHISLSTLDMAWALCRAGLTAPCLVLQRWCLT